MEPAVRIAIDLLHLPSQVRRIRSAPLPDDLIVLLRIASGDADAAKRGAGQVGRSIETVRDAAAFFLIQVLLSPDADSYRVLGARPEATNADLRRNMALLLRWLHPDHDRKGEWSVFAARVTRAWNDLKTSERRAAYDRLRRKSMSDETLLRKKGRSRAQSNRPGFNQRSHGRMRHAGHMALSPTFYICAVKCNQALRRVLLLLLGKTVP
jgi:hypothetical protein